MRSRAAIGCPHIIEVILSCVILDTGIVRIHPVEELWASARKHDPQKAIRSLRMVGNTLNDFTVIQPIPTEPIFFLPSGTEHMILSLCPDHRTIPNIVVLHLECYNRIPGMKREARHIKVLALVGLGGISNTHLPVWKELDDCELVAVCDTRPEQMDAYPDARHYTDFYEMLEKEKLDILDITALIHFHGQFFSLLFGCDIHIIPNNCLLYTSPSPRDTR